VDARPASTAPTRGEGGSRRPPAEALNRDPFAFADDTTAASREARLPPATGLAAPTPAPALVPPPVPPVRLIGFVEDERGLRAALVVLGETVVLGAGESQAGFRVLALDRDGGVILSDPAGGRVTLEPAAR
jgi:hypothetical protein